MGLEKIFKSYVECYQSLKSEEEKLSDLFIHYDFESGSMEEFDSLRQSLNQVREDMHTVSRCLSAFVLDYFDRIKFE